MPDLAESAGPLGPQLVSALLAEQQELTAVEKFAQRHAQLDAPLGQRYYRDLIPLALPGAGQQYAFEVDLDLCSGCKACVTACHQLNGLDENETWRSVGLLHGGTSQLPVLQHVTAACHHCVEPACLYGCPTKAYEKDPITGIVKHLDDQCIGCQYCIFKCPYDVPKYNRALGIVRKCDMCSDRLASGEAPACVQACPNVAIRIKIVDHQAVIEDSEANVFLPGAPEPHYTLPSTTYKTAKSLPRNMLPADYYALSAGHAHMALVWMLVLTQLSVGMFITNLTLDSLVASPGAAWVQLAGALGAGGLGLSAAVFHLGRPLYAFRAMVGLRTSWLSREILAFGLFAKLAAAYALAVGLGQSTAMDTDALARGLRLAAAGCGLAGVLCSAMIYADTRRPFWSLAPTGTKFLLSGIITGGPAALLVALAAALVATGSTRQLMHSVGRDLCLTIVAASLAKIGVEACIFAHLHDKKHTPLKRTAMLMAGELALTTMKRFFFGMIGGVLLPLVLVGEPVIAGAEGFDPAFVLALAALACLVSLLGELYERYEFFAAVVAPKMPGGLAS